MKIEDIRKIAQGSAILLYREYEAIVALTPWWDCNADELRESQRWSLRQEGITT